MRRTQCSSGERAPSRRVVRSCAARLFGSLGVPNFERRPEAVLRLRLRSRVRVEAEKLQRLLRAVHSECERVDSARQSIWLASRIDLTKACVSL